MMHEETIKKLNNAKVGDVIETKKWIITVKDGDDCSNCYREYLSCRGIICNCECTIDRKNHIFIRERRVSEK